VHIEQIACRRQVCSGAQDRQVEVERQLSNEEAAYHKPIRIAGWMDGWMDGRIYKEYE